ncbi:TIGR00295 family protein [Methanobrevibacter sp. DSM 116169]|uniref:TIGR00295 family protein n=1 Tax=Methanobrevibacter sp. DSM 116169 TaxID=3242727 RepID=UPI0038FC491C
MELEILKKEKCNKHIINHSIAVCNKAMEIAKHFDNVDLDAIKKGALLHDLGRSRTQSINHAIEGAKIAKEYGYSEEIINIIEKHIGAGISEEESIEMGLPKKSYIPKTLEEKIVAHSDNLINGVEEVDIDFVIDKWKDTIRHPKENINRLKQLNELLVEPYEKEQ